MSKKIEKQLREAAKKDHQKILDSNKPFFDEVLMPIAEEKILMASQEKKKRRRLRFKRYAYIAAPLLVAIVIVLSVFLPSSPDNGYLGPFITEPSDLSAINQCLTETQLYGDFGTVIRSFDQKTYNTMYFTLSHEITKDDAAIESNIELIIERSLTFDFEKTDYRKRLTFLGYEVKFNETLLPNTYDDMPLLELIIEAYFDTGKERYFITYNEITINETSSFKDYLASIIKTKNI